MPEPEYRRILRKTAEKNERAARRRLDLWGVRGLWFAAIVAVAAICYAHYDASQQYAALRAQQVVMRGQLDEMRAEQRPWIQVQFMLNGPLTYDVNGARISLIARVSNGGHLPALDVTISPRAFPFFGNIHGTLDINQERRAACQAAEHNKLDFGNTVFPGVPIDMPIEFSIPKADLDAVGDMTPSHVIAIAPFILLCAGYHDAAGIPHHTPTSLELGMNPAAIKPGRGCCLISVMDGPQPAENLRLRLSVFAQGQPD